MFASRISSIAALAILLVSQVAAAPMPMPMRLRHINALAQREAAPLEIIPAYVRRDEANAIPEEVATKSDNGDLQTYRKRGLINTIPAQIATRSVNGVIEYY